MTDEMMTVRCHVAEGARLVAGSCSWLAEEHRDDGALTREACLWMSLAALAVSVALVAERCEHPTIASTITMAADGAETATIMLRAVGALHEGDRDRANMLASLGAKLGESL
jgi:hypothetical protein